MAEYEQWKERAELSPFITFPIRIEWNGEKWDKKPLVGGWSHSTFATRWPAHRWGAANGYGIVTGGEHYMVDLDDYKDGAAGIEWLRDKGIPTDTRTHRSISGGFHKFYALPKGWGGLGNRSSIAPGIDTRGAGGFAAFGDGYEVVDDRFPVLLNPEHCEMFKSLGKDRGGDGPGIITDDDLPGYLRPKDTEEVLKRLAYWREWNTKLDMRFNGQANGLTQMDRSRSQIDMSVAGILCRLGFTSDEIVWILMEVLETGAARYTFGQASGMHKGLRLAMRAAAAAELGKKDMTKVDKVLSGPSTNDDTDEVERAMKSLLGGS